MQRRSGARGQQEESLSYVGSESASQVQADGPLFLAFPSLLEVVMEEEEEDSFEYTENTTYEEHTPVAMRRDKGSTSTPRFEIVSKGRGKDFEMVKLKQ